MPDIVWQAERAFWLEGMPREGIRPDTVMVFPHPTGILKGAAIEKSLEGGTSWKSVAFYQITEGGRGDVAVIGYRAVATRARMDTYQAFCTSTYVREGDRWRILCHQQSPVT